MLTFPRSIKVEKVKKYVNPAVPKFLINKVFFYLLSRSCAYIHTVHQVYLSLTAILLYIYSGHQVVNSSSAGN
jgi:hypothetical protein